MFAIRFGFANGTKMVLCVKLKKKKIETTVGERSFQLQTKKICPWNW